MSMTLPEPETPSSSKFVLGLAAGAGLVILLVGAFLIFNRGGGGNVTPASQPVHLPFGAPEQAYAAQLKFSGLELSHATNMASQELIYVVGTVANTGTRTVRAAEVSVEFQDLIHQIVLRDTVPLFPAGADPLAPGGQRRFQLTFEHVPQSWNHEAPLIRVTGLDLQ